LAGRRVFWKDQTLVAEKAEHLDVRLVCMKGTCGVEKTDDEMVDLTVV
jgi:hypothetical protein